MRKNGKKSQKMVKNCQKCPKNPKKCFFFEMLRKSSKMPIKPAIFQKIKHTKKNFAYTLKIRIIRIFSAPDGVLDGGKSPPHGRAERSEGRGLALRSPRRKSARTGQGRGRFGQKKYNKAKNSPNAFPTAKHLLKLGRQGRACKKIEQSNKANKYFFWLHACAPLSINHEF